MKRIFGFILFLVLTFSTSAQIMGGKAGFGGTAGSGGGGSASPSSPTVIQVCAAATFGTSLPCTFSSNITSGNTLVGWFTGQPAGTALNLPSGCVTWTIPSGGSTSSFNLQQWAIGSVTSTVGCTVTETTTGATQSMSAMIWEISNVTQTVDGTIVFASSFQTGTFNGPSVTTTTNGDIILTAGYNTNATTTLVVNSPFVSDFSATFSGGNGNMGAGHIVQGSFGSITPSYTASAGVTVNMSTLALKP